MRKVRKKSLDLQEGYDLTGDERLKSKIENLQVKIKEAEKLLIQQKREGFTTDQRNRLVMIRNSMINGSCYLTYEQIEKEVSPYIELLEKYKELFPDNVYGWADLEIFYYMIGEYEACLDIRKQVYEITGDESYSEEYVESGRVITRRSYNSSAETDGDYTEYFDSIYTYEYDNNGRVAKCTLERYHGGSEEIYRIRTIKIPASGNSAGRDFIISWL